MDFNTRLGVNILANANLASVADVERLTSADLHIPTDSEQSFDSTSTSSAASHITDHFPDSTENGELSSNFLYEFQLNSLVSEHSKIVSAGLIADIVNGVLLEHGINLSDFKRGHMYYSQESHLETCMTKTTICLMNKLTKPTSSLDSYMSTDLTYKISGSEYYFSECESPVSRDFVLTQQLPENESFSINLPDYLSNVDDAATNLGLGNDFLFIILLILLSSEFITSTASSPFTYINVC